MLRLLSIALCGSVMVAQETRRIDLVIDGEPRDVVAAGEWERREGYLRARGLERLLSGGAAIGRGDFLVTAKIALEALDGSAASLQLGESHFGFDGRDRTVFVEGPLFDGLQHLGPSEERIAAGEPFEVRAERRAGRLELAIDGEVVHAVEIGDEAIGRVALRPWRAAMRVYTFAAEGTLEPLPPSVLEHAVFRAGTGAYHTYRIPAAVVTADGTVLAFCEGRVGGRGDAGDIDLLVRRSTDGGRTWSETAVLWDDGPNTCGNPAPVVDRETGTICLLATWNRGDDTEREIIDGTSTDTRRVFVIRSDDDGRTWSEPDEITAAVKADDWTWYATGPGNGIQLARGAHAGRLVVPCDHIEFGTKRYFSHAIFSDDGGATWQRGASTPQDQVNECAVVERADGTLLLNMRNYDRSQRTRQIAFSDDGGATWRDQRHDPALVEPICQASLARDAGGRLLFSNPASKDARTHLTVRLSTDDGATWSHRTLLHAGPSAYSQLVVLGDGRVACLFEAGESSPYEAIVWLPVTFDD